MVAPRARPRRRRRCRARSGRSTSARGAQKCASEGPTYSGLERGVVALHGESRLALVLVHDAPDRVKPLPDREPGAAEDAGPETLESLRALEHDGAPLEREGPERRGFRAEPRPEGELPLLVAAADALP